MTNFTGAELEEIRKHLESAAALNLGRLLFAFSYLDVNLSLLLVASGGGKEREALTEKIADYSFHKKLLFLEEMVNSKFQTNSEVYNQYKLWLQEAHLVRNTRNQLVHGRWGIVPHQQRVANIIGLPGENNQVETLYTISDLEKKLAAIQLLEKKLQKLRRSYPV